MDTDDDTVPLSALQHWLFCPRQCALIHVERQWLENRYTAEGKVLHERVDTGGQETRGDLRVLRAVPLLSRRLGIHGVADVVEATRAAIDHPDACALPGLPGMWRLEPVEYKRGSPKPTACDTVQLCAQAICLEEQFGARIASASLFYFKTRRRLAVPLDAHLRRTTEDACSAIASMMATGHIPPPVNDYRCSACSLAPVCQPRLSVRTSASRWCADQFHHSFDDSEAEP